MMSSRRLAAAIPICLILTSLFAAAPALAWNDTGHDVAAFIALQELTLAERTQAINILKKHPRFQEDLLDKLPQDFDPDLYAFMRAATWPDLVRSETHALHQTEHHGVWHYVNY